MSLLSLAKKVVKKIFPGVSWQNPVINLMYRLVDPLDYVVRLCSGRHHMPLYSIRVRSNGITEQFGGRKFQENGKLIKDILIKSAGLEQSSRVLEIGCGCGRTAVALAEYLKSGSYTGVDIERVSLDACKKISLLNRDRFTFEVLDVYNSAYNPCGTESASDYHFPFADKNFDNIFLISVFTHMLKKDIEHYVGEISRLLDYAGTALISTFLMDKGTVGERISFPFSEEGCYFNNREMPEVAVGYSLNFFERIAKEKGLELVNSPIWGTWRDATDSLEGRFPQDIVILRKIRM